MATKLFFREENSTYGTGNNDLNLRGSSVVWKARSLSTSAGSGAIASPAMPTVAGATVGVEVTSNGELTSTAAVWCSAPLAAAATISGSITWNIWGRESSNSANVAINGQIEKVDAATGAITLIDKTARTTEMAVSATTNSVNNFSETPAAGVAMKKGDRLRVRIFGDDSTTMGSGFTFQIGYDGGTGAANGDTWVQLTENLTFVGTPAGTQVFLTDTASAVSTASVDREAWTSRGAGVQTDIVNTATGFTSPIQWTDTAGGTVVDWFTRPLTAFTLGGSVRVNLRIDSSNLASNAGPHIEIARVAGDGSSPTIWGVFARAFPSSSPEHTEPTGFPTNVDYLSGDDLAISDGQRLRIRLSIDDAGAAMVSGHTVTLYYAGGAGASGDSYLTFSQTLTEYVPPAANPPARRDLQQMLAH